MQTASTTEIDDIDDALGEILGQLDLDTLGKNSVGILFGWYEFVETGVVGALCERLPFDVVGMTTMASASDGALGMYRLCLTVLSSDDVSFETAVTSPISADNCELEIETAYRRARGKLPCDPSFIISFFPFVNDISGSDILKNFDKICGGIPIWGSVASGMDITYEHCRTLWKGGADKTVLAMLLVYGPVEPKFIVTSIPERNMRDSSAIITESEGCVIKEVNGMNFGKYLESVGLSMRTVRESTTIPLMINYGDGSKPVALAIYDMRDDGTALCGGETPQDSALIIGQIDRDGIVETAGASMEAATDGGVKNGVLLLPCVSRYMMLTPQQDEEMELVTGSVGGKAPYVMGYSGGEVCPMLGKDGKYYNHFHNYTFSACVF
ncbi:MAG: FIST C-terminal domain-containing protein [Synergistaceae bacterium]|jgi:hypothetical protein|nr:FIST C-terminal domain-containing protein [Synergistaceae bacterium]